MSSRPRPPAAAGRPAAGRPQAGKAPQERKAPKGPIVTPQALGILFGLILLIGIAVYWQMVIVHFSKAKQDVEQQIAQAESRIDTYRKKGAKLEEAHRIDNILREKLRALDPLFLEDQNSIVPFFEDYFFPLIDSSRLRPSDDTKIELKEYTFRINMAMNPFNTLPASQFFENADKLFPIQYIGEKDGVPEDTPLDTRYGDFLVPYQIKMKDFRGTYEDVMDFIEKVQQNKQDYLYTIHCLKNDDSKNAGVIRTFTDWTIQLSVYFMNPEGAASGDTPPDPPGSLSC